MGDIACVDPDFYNGKLDYVLSGRYAQESLSLEEFCHLMLTVPGKVSASRASEQARLEP